MAKVKTRKLTPDDPIFQEGPQVILVPLTSAPRPARRLRLCRGNRGGGMPSVFADDNDMFDESTWISAEWSDCQDSDIEWLDDDD